MPEPTIATRRAGAGRVIVGLYALFTVAAGSRAAYQIATRFHEAPLAYALSAFSAVVYALATVVMARSGRTSYRIAVVACSVELAGVLAIGTASVVAPSAFPDATVWSDYGMGYLFIPLVLPVAGLLWLRRVRRGTRAATTPTAP